MSIESSPSSATAAAAESSDGAAEASAARIESSSPALEAAAAEASEAQAATEAPPRVASGGEIYNPAARSARDPEQAAAEQKMFADNEPAMRYGREAAHLSPAGSQTDYGKLQGALGEGLHHYSNGGAFGFVNDLNDKIGKNNPGFDSSSRKELTSIKTHLSEKRSDLSDRYASDLRTMVGAKEGQKLDKFTDRVWQMKAEGGQKWYEAKAVLPAGVVNAESPAAMRTAVVDEAVLRIPADHVGQARDYVLRNAQRHPAVYGLDPTADATERETRANMLAMKIQPLADSVTSQDISRMTRANYQIVYPKKA